MRRELKVEFWKKEGSRMMCNMFPGAIHRGERNISARPARKYKQHGICMLFQYEKETLEEYPVHDLSQS